MNSKSKEKTPPRKMASVYLGIFFVSLSAIIFEISLTKIFSVILWYHFAYLAVSFALFGLGAGGLTAFLMREFFSKHFPAALKHLASLQFLSMIACLLLILNTPPSIARFYIRLSMTYLVCSIPFFLVGLTLSLVMYHFVKDVPKIYFADLVGSGTGCIVFILAITLFSGPSVVIMGALLSLVAAFFFSEPRVNFKYLLRIGIFVTAAICLFCLYVRTDIFYVKYTKEHAETEALLFEKWSPLARITVYPTIFWRPNPNDPFFWGTSKKYQPQEPVKQLWIEQDASAGTPITNFSGDISELEFLKYDVTSFVYHVQPQAENTFIIGCGGGRDVLTALFFGVPSIRACDINPIIVHLVKDKHKEFAGNIYELPGVDVEVAEGRTYIRNQDQRFDVIQISLIDSWAATVAGAFALAENNLYTVEAFRDYIDHLDDTGMLSITRFIFRPRNQTLRVAILARKALESEGIEHPERNIAVISTARETKGLATTLIKRSALTQSDIERIQKAADDLGFAIIYLPERGGDQEFTEALTKTPLEAFLKEKYYDLSPSTDDKPFFFQMLRFSRAFDLFTGHHIVGQKFNYYAPFVLIVLLAFSFTLILLFYILPLLLSRRVESLPRLWGLYFVLLGIGFMFVEIPLLQKGTLYLGHPTLSLSVVVFSMLTFAGYGSYYSRKFREESLLKTVRKYLLLIALLIGIVTVGSDWLIRYTIGFSLLFRIILFVVLIGPAAFLMGTAFPSGIRLVGQEHRNSIPWVWALNGGASVMGSVLAMTVAMVYGYMLTLIIGGTCYLVALGATYRRRRATTIKA
ncbi:MAG: hypothetical protein JXB45_08655 [Candidatus Krumholzibacteriota bacterium]|nr:hypothetical protein [Candidatus Krumholzibacteriota bacterium]